ncbi:MULTISPECIES: large conductance mechanosensitive channel protein MscL [Spongiibacter]|jgi:large conductance mechanosensitive channel|uniref:large conductance mechanosensitive channel protein MscL n=1 Tax=Spongiibacter TaxID=630749 RepID=UPI0003B681A2|nr:MULTISPECIES: large conductance mechanosensitive channel protein MscL [Spongiibacter]MAY38341.1 large conductance mechanosensitive channel protein MscL [Spongiibacter sp.]|tara:strand:- start:999 stop:1433 length:435 start_codon:yes stop_codon:yes gene_type:complete
MAILNEFKTFITKGNMVDMAVGIVIGAAFTTVVKSLVTDIIMPPVGMMTGGIDFSNFFIALDGQHYNSLDEATKSGAATINYGLFVNNIITLLIVGAAVFGVVKTVNRIKAKEEEAPKAPAKPSEEVLLLREIRDALSQPPEAK